jgi:excinuclease ABC subunit A
MTRKRSARPTTWSTSAPARASMAGRSSPARRRDHAADPASLTGQYLSGRARSPVPPSGARARSAAVVKGATGNNLKRRRRLPAGRVRLRHRRLGRRQVHPDHRDAVQDRVAKLNGARQTPAPCETIKGLEHLDKVIDIDQRPIGRTPRSNPATYTGAFTPIRDWFAGLPEAKARGYKPGASPSTSRAGAARPARATASSRSRCTSCPMST